MSKRWRPWIRFGALGAAVLGFMVGSVLSVRAISAYQANEAVNTSTGTWMAVQTEVEYLNLVNTLERAAHIPGLQGEVALRFDLLWSRLPLIGESSEAAMLKTVPDALAVATDLLGELRRLDPVVHNLPKSGNPDAAIAATLDALKPFGPRLQRMVQNAVLGNEHGGPERLALERRALAMLGFTFAAGALLVVMLVLEGRRARREELNARLADERLRSALDAASVGFVLFDAEERLVTCNERFRDMYALKDEEAQPRTPFEAVVRCCLDHGRHLQALGDPEAWVRSRLAQFRMPESSHHQQLANGRWIDVRERRLPNGGSIGVRIDITELKRREAALAEALGREERASRAKSEFLANMSHELRTPLNAIIGFSEFMQAEIFGPLGNPRYAEYVGDIHASGQHLLGVIADILDMARVEAGHLALDEKPADLGEVVGSSVRIMHQRAAEAGVAVVVAMPDAVPAIVMDAQRMRQVLINLLSNAVKFTVPGGTVRIEAELDAQGLELRVRDTGIGMSEAEIGVALSPFGQVDRTVHRKSEGTGLGLPISRALVELHGGTLQIESRPGAGTIVRIRLPAQRLVAAPA